MARATLLLMFLLWAVACPHLDASVCRRQSQAQRSYFDDEDPAEDEPRRLRRAAPAYYQHQRREAGAATCLTERCVRRAERLLDAMDRGAEPCDDFAKFACGGRFLRDKSSGASDSPTEYARRQKYINNFIKNKLAGAPDPKWSMAEMMAQMYYKTCQEGWFTEKSGIKLAQQLARAVGADHLYAIDLKTAPKTLGHMLRVLDEKFGVQLAPAVTRFRNESGDCSIMVHDGGDYKAFDEDSDMAAADDVTEIADLLKGGLELAEDFTATVKELCEEDHTIRKTTVRQLARNAPEFGWPEFLNMDERNPTPIYVEGCVLKLSKELSKFQLNYPMRLRSMLVARAMRRLWKVAPKGADTSQDCLTFTRKYFSDALTTIYVSEANHKLNLTGTPAVMGAVAAALVTRFERASWIDTSSRNFYISKLKTMTFYMGYDEAIVDEREKLEAHYFMVNLREELPVDLMRLARWHYAAVEKKCDIAVWDEVPPLEVSGEYRPIGGSLVAPLGLMSGTEYDPAQPNVLNYAALGVDLGLLLMFALHKDFRDTDQWGNRYNVSKNTLARLDSDEECLTKHFQRMSGDDDGDDKKDYSGYSAELHGLKLAYAAWLATGGLKDELLPGVSELYTPQQIFYILYAQANCDEGKREQSGRERTMSTLSQIPEVASMWNCPAGSKLNPAVQCKLW